MKRIVKGGLTPKMILDDVFCNFSPQIHPSSCDDDDFFVDQLLNLNNDEIQPLETHQLQQQQQQQHMDTSNALLVNSQQQQADEDKETPFLSSPLDTAEEADLEWLSHFVDDSFGPYSTPFPPGYVCPKPESKPEPKPKPVEDEAPALSLRKACRRKRARTGCRVWAGSQPEPTSPSSSPTLKQGTRKRDGSGQQRRCSHCGVQKTPQWRAGPNGSKTLCNACGVRFKSGRLVPEYRPACSPTFSSELHSNSHRKVMEMRMKKEGGPKFVLFHHVSSFG